MWVTVGQPCSPSHAGWPAKPPVASSVLALVCICIRAPGPGEAQKDVVADGRRASSSVCGVFLFWGIQVYVYVSSLWSSS